MNILVKHFLRLKRSLQRSFKMLELTLKYGKQFEAEKFHYRDTLQIIIEDKGQLSVGKNCFFNTGCSITVREKVAIGANCIFGENVKIYDHNHEYRAKDTPIYKQGFTSEPVVIEEDCWIGSNVVILKGVRIGAHSVIGAGVIVYKEVPAGSVLVCKQELVLK